ncbi:HAMP domain-containing protein [Massilia arenosa]|uniref:HAMP domain-containing protein n=1 Tax=Zemynaea arenosa TaxID=2561931 RepID=A0A4Y9RU56_9BURK|nr:methyl-accepting chemotaxis protein [Massilia arenosa]TFW11395.1 HAMP domain-containing protein [Massilia arenosa]
MRSVRSNLLVLNVLSIVFMAVVGGVGWLTVGRLDGAMDKITDNGNALSHQMSADQDHDALRGDVMAAFVAGAGDDTAARQAVAKEASDHIADFKQNIRELEEVGLDGEVRARLAAVKPDMDAYLKLAAELVPLALGDQAAARERLPAFNAAFEKLEKSMAGLSETIERNSVAARDGGDAVVKASHWQVLAAVGIAAALAIGIGLVISRRITEPLDEAIVFAGRVSEGDLSAHIDSDATDTSELGRLKRSLHDMQAKLLAMVTEIRAGADRIAVATREISDGNMDLSARTEEQASSLEETASSLEELTSTVQQNSAHAREAEQLATTARGVAEQGGQVVADVVQTMGAISEASQRIVQIISTIEGIAFQTNILALNAAVEAARAGEQGRGFAVVANEVRTLAQRADAAAKEIKVLIDASVEQVERGDKLVATAGSTMEKVVSSVMRVGGVVTEIAGATSEQEVGLGQINSAVAQIDSATQQNAALVEEAAAATASLQEQAHHLAALVAQFRIEGGSAPRTSSALRLAQA